MLRDMHESETNKFVLNLVDLMLNETDPCVVPLMQQVSNIRTVISEDDANSVFYITRKKF